MGRGGTGASRQRAHTVLDATAERVASVGADKTTLEDVARAAGISKSTLYLHWNTREELMSALLRRERVAMLDTVRERMAARPAGTAAPASLYRDFVLAMADHPLLRPVVDQTSELVRGLASRKRHRPPADDILQDELHRYLTALHDSDLVRTDLSVRELGNVLHAVVMGTLVTGTQTPERFTLPHHQRADLLAETLERVLGPTRELSSDEMTERARITHDHLRRVTRAARRKLDLSLGIDTSGDPDDEERSA